MNSFNKLEPYTFDSFYSALQPIYPTGYRANAYSQRVPIVPSYPSRVPTAPLFNHNQSQSGSHWHKSNLTRHRSLSDFTEHENSYNYPWLEFATPQQNLPLWNENFPTSTRFDTAYTVPSYQSSLYSYTTPLTQSSSLAHYGSNSLKTELQGLNLKGLDYFCKNNLMDGCNSENIQWPKTPSSSSESTTTTTSELGSVLNLDNSNLLSNYPVFPCDPTGPTTELNRTSGKMNSSTSCHGYAHKSTDRTTERPQLGHIAPRQLPADSAEIDRIMAKIEQDNRVLAELDKTRATVGRLEGILSGGRNRLLPKAGNRAVHWNLSSTRSKESDISKRCDAIV
ncbi:hypothetical protein Phum_PHUM240770 [Pediculus humanus corporis]|uniref:Uncharacterized protein n=1 Tax=Pediculus humanus subsp. corporis TaxID=121224 RepID=E0VJ97_PEDHC|nr:uncharacterized protein Phum_PHUM240770 [Pediculus humanus corporis]EEB13453.1 hypothetical protein Phum_PHUM240770 [Pediculus humanus corporis]